MVVESWKISGVSELGSQLEQSSIYSSCAFLIILICMYVVIIKEQGRPTLQWPLPFSNPNTPVKIVNSRHSA